VTRTRSSLRTLAGLAVAACAAVAPAAALPPTSASVALSSARAGAKPVVLTLLLGYDMQCGYPGTEPIVVIFPAQERLPARIPATAVLVDGHAAPTVSVAGHVVRIGLGVAPPRVMCDVIASGTLRLVFTRAAGLGNPARAGSYRLNATKGTAAFSATYTIRGA